MAVPTVTSQAASSVSGTGATLNGNVNPNNAASDTFFQCAADAAFSTNVHTLAGSGERGYLDGPGAAAQFYAPTGVRADAAGNVYVADTANHRIRKITAAGVVSTLAGTNSGSYADGTGAAARLNRPYDVAVDAIGNVFVADYENLRH